MRRRRSRRGGTDFMRLTLAWTKLFSPWTHMVQAQRKIDLEKAKIETERARAIVLQNQVVLGDLAIEKRKLEILRLEQKLGINHDFTPSDYPDPSDTSRQPGPTP